MLSVLRILLIILGIAAIAICLSILFLGPSATASSSEHLYNAVMGWRGRVDGAWPATMDSELRFYAPFWGAYGVLLIATARDLSRLGLWVPWLALLFFAGGVGRAISWMAAGPPHPFFLLLMAIELVTPPVLALLWWGGRASSGVGQG